MDMSIAAFRRGLRPWLKANDLYIEATAVVVIGLPLLGAGWTWLAYMLGMAKLVLGAEVPGLAAEAVTSWNIFEVDSLTQSVLVHAGFGYSSAIVCGVAVGALLWASICDHGNRR